MRNVTSETLTDLLLNLSGPDTDPRVQEVLGALVKHLHAFATEVGLTHSEWRKGLELLTRAGEISDAERNEFVLLSDVLGLSSLVDMINSPDDCTSSSVLGPFHVLGAPQLPVGGDLIGDNAGQQVVVQGVVRDQAGAPIEGAVIELWQTADNGLYSGQDATQPDYNLRMAMTTGADGRYAVSTIRPTPYLVPTDGPAGDILNATGRHAWRPSHLHFIIEAAGYRSLVTEVFPSDDPYLDEDAVFGVREDLVMEFQPGTRAALPADIEARDRLDEGFSSVEFDFVLPPA
ncbi:dioxygenase [Pararhodobacter oceanensis]|uniref:Hydroxyquinol 1,2-dioxygenase n=1 Tax=Pararhodobacter oceanensis TaxID=2172121 RepID=A0A2T8HQB4_9RHOB|nr:dioxygenase [Pararhodobacter oceanensis]PVH27638.1 hydroxyquinol 1,2-dioxygenase [Pararhodobacter oceanensis]